MGFTNISHSDSRRTSIDQNQKLDQVIELLKGIQSELKMIVDDLDELLLRDSNPDLERISSSVQKISDAVSKQFPE